MKEMARSAVKVENNVAKSVKMERKKLKLKKLSVINNLELIINNKGLPSGKPFLFSIASPVRAVYHSDGCQAIVSH